MKIYVALLAFLKDASRYEDMVSGFSALLAIHILTPTPLNPLHDDSQEDVASMT